MKAQLTDREVVAGAKAAVRIELEKNKAKNVPSIVYDSKTKKIYQLNSDGSRIVVAERLEKGSYSERMCKTT